MSSANRYVNGEKGTVLVPVQGGVTVELGDLMFIDNDINLRNDGSSTATLYAFPLEYFRTTGASLTVNQQSVKSHFIGVALDDKDGQTGSPFVNIPVATKGEFEFPLKPARSVINGSYFGASGSTSGSDLYNQKIKKVTDSNFSLGIFSELKTHAKSARVFIHTILGSSVNTT